MKILYLHQYFYFPSEYGTTRSYWISKKLIEQGHTVTVITSTQRSQKKLVIKEQVENIDLIYIKIPYDNKMSKQKRVFAFIKFMFQSSLQLIKLKDVDLVYATSTPLTVAIPALIRNFLHKTPFIFEVRDLWPEFPIQVGAIKNKFIIKILRKLEKVAYNKSVHIVALSPGMMDGVIDSGIMPAKVSVVPNMSKPDIFYPREKSNELSEKFGIDLNKFNVVHFGAMGVANGLDYILRAAENAQQNKINDINFIFVGDGSVKIDLMNYSKRKNLNNVLFIGKQATTMISEIVNLCNVSIVTFKNIPVLKTNSPNKLFDSLSAAKPVIVNSDGWTKSLVEDGNCGFYVNPEQPKELVEKLIQIKSNESLYKAMSTNARKLSIDKFNKEKLTDIILKIVEEVNT